MITITDLQRNIEAALYDGGEGLLNNEGVDEKVCHEIAQGITEKYQLKDELPDTIGYWWFYGTIEKHVPGPILHMVEVISPNKDGVLAYRFKGAGHFYWASNPYIKGQWAPAIVPELMENNNE